jgi:hypothetical protein
MKKTFDFTGVETFQRAPEGVHSAKVTKIDEVTFQGGNVGFKITFEITAGAGKGARVIENYPFVDAAMWKLKAFFEACGIRANGRISVDIDKLIGKAVEITVNHEEYNGQLRARIQEVNKLTPKAAAEDADDEDDEDLDEEIEDEEIEEEEKPKKTPKKAEKKSEKKSAEKETKSTKKSAKKAEELEEDEDDWDEDDWDDEE